MVPVPVVVVDAVRTPFGRHADKIARWHAVDLLTAALTGAVERAGISPGDIDNVIVGCANPIGEQALNISRNASLAAGWPEHLTAHTVDAQGASGVMALHEACARIASGMATVCVVGAVASTRVPDGATSGMAVGQPFGAMVHDRFAKRNGLRSPGLINEHLARQHDLSREDLDAYAVTSLAAAVTAEESGTKKPYVLELADTNKVPTVITKDSFLRAHDITKLKPLFETDGLLTGATFATPASGAVAMVVAHPDFISRTPLGKIMWCASAGNDVLDGSSGSAFVENAVDQAMRNKITRIEVQEDSAAAPLAFARSNPLPESIVNHHGGSLAIGDAFGVSALASIVSLLHDDFAGLGMAVTAGANGISTATVVDLHK